jgi:hypothetical protein
MIRTTLGPPDCSLYASSLTFPSGILNGREKSEIFFSRCIDKNVQSDRYTEGWIVPSYLPTEPPSIHLTPER